ncbi:penicillin-binding protein [Planotetraspora thailandica]|uniref:Penicillin-binding protein n=1 Tax=Planotetraspora thailandica TaxID=487172 RepID=A0A8J3V2V8_9ACTN|nr:penicillin-binding transpeptidase domain-containing protein [Planotetraspora thailandica]GII56724.1 penicillin-binding protein [Planotetraspora thailandica]
MSNRTRTRALLVLITVAGAIFITSILSVLRSGEDAPAGAVSTPSPSLMPEVEGSPDKTATSYLKAWAAADYAAMRELTDEPPSDFEARHQAFEETLAARSLRLTPGEVVSTGDGTAEVPFTEVRELRDYGRWSYRSTLHLGVRDYTWKVLWTPAVLHPDLAPGGEVERRDTPATARAFTTSEGRRFPEGSDAERYLQKLADTVPLEEGEPVGWEVRIQNPGARAERLVAYEPERKKKDVRTTIEWEVQAAAARALDGVKHPAAVVVVRPSTGEILAVADRLGGRKAFEQKYAPGSTFKTVTASALLRSGMSTETMVDCPASYQIPGGRSIPNFRDEEHGSVTLRRAFALSCNTSFARLAVERLDAGSLMEETQVFGFGASLATGAGGTCGSMRSPDNDDALAEDSFGQGTVEATPLCMALVAAAVQSGEWRPPRLLASVPGRDQPPTVSLPFGVAAGLRTMMNAVTSGGTASGAGLPAGAAGKTGTAEDWQGGADHSWFIGYWGDLAFSVFIEHGGTGRDAAVPVAGRFLRAL